MITRLKSTFVYEVLESLPVEKTENNTGVIKDERIQLKSSKKAWRLVTFQSPEGYDYEYLTNDFSLSPGIIAFLYHKRWDEEKYFDTYKTDLGNTKAWAKSSIAIEQQALLGLVRHILMRLFLHEQGEKLGLEEDHQTQKKRHNNKARDYFYKAKGYYNRVFYKKLSKITKQAWRFLRNCFLKKSTQQLFERKLRPVLMAYL